eukprot:TRINITY_DN3717_c0_g1_i1.p1 TRINITY_DN3717_c0_g1~~TRINITY_DN3717_c0_g1_i1.p1  ORF type:complete len:512 (+),score=131.46 TRINITY_DN3717_c0_g1_i1:75-1538(+)
MEIGQDYLEDSGVDEAIYLPGDVQPDDSQEEKDKSSDSVQGEAEGKEDIDMDSYEDDSWSVDDVVLLPPGAMVVSSDQSESSVSDCDDVGVDHDESSSWGGTSVHPPSLVPYVDNDSDSWGDSDAVVMRENCDSDSWADDTVVPSIIAEEDSWGSGKPPAVTVSMNDGWSDSWEDLNDKPVCEDSWENDSLPPSVAKHSDWGEDSQTPVPKVVDDDGWSDSSDNFADVELYKAFFVQEDENVKGLKARRDNRGMQDAHTVYTDVPGYAVFAVFDGHGEDGEGCSQALQELWGKKVLPGFIENIKDSAKYWDNIYQEIEAGLVEYEFGGSTCTSVIVWKDALGRRYLQCTNVGDSEAFLIRNGTPVALTEIHRPNSEHEKERLKGIIEPGKTRIGGSLAVSRSFGDSFLKDGNTGAVCNPFVSQVFLIEEGDTHVILASDGLWDFVSAEEAIQIIENNPNADIAELLLRASITKPKSKDNITVIVVVL